MQRTLLAAVTVSAVALGSTSSVAAQPGTSHLTTVNIPAAVLADGRPLPAGTYQLRLTDQWLQPLQPGGQQGMRWVDFVTNGMVAGREAALVIPASAIDEISSWHPAVGDTRVDRLQSGEFVRIWVNRDGTHYLIHLPIRR